MNRRTFLLTPVAAAAAAAPQQSGVESGREAPRAAAAGGRSEASPSCSSIPTGPSRPSTGGSTGTSSSTSTTRWKTVFSPSRSKAADSRARTLPRTGSRSRTAAASSSRRSNFKNGKKSVRLRAEGGRAGIRQGRIFVDAGREYDGSIWIKREAGALRLTLRVATSQGRADRLCSARVHGFRLAGGPLPLHQSRAGHAGLGGDRGGRHRIAAPRFRFHDAGGRPPRRRAAPGPPAGAPRSRAALHPLARADPSRPPTSGRTASAPTCRAVITPT